MLMGGILPPGGSGVVTRDTKRAAGPVASAPGFLCRHSIDERAGAHALERAPEASAARRAEAQRTGSERRPGWPT